MAIEIKKRPYSYCFSRNPVYYELYSAAAAADPNIFFEIRVQFKLIGGVYVATEALPYSPVNGYAEIDIKDLLEGLLAFDLPQFDADETRVWPSANQTGNYYLQYREITPTNGDPTWDDAEMSYPSLVVKGGIALFKYQGNNFWVNYFNAITDNAPRPFLSWQKRGRLASQQERMYLAYLLIDDITDMSIVAKVTYIDGTIDTLTVAVAGVERNKIYYIPSGAIQLGLDQLNIAKDIWYWEIKLTSGGNDISESFKYLADNKNRLNYLDITLSYRASIGGIDSVRPLGTIKRTLDYDFQEQAKTMAPDYYDGNSYAPLSIISNNKETLAFRGDIGFLGKVEQDRLRDAFMNREVWWERSKKWIPMKIITKTIDQYTTDDTRFHLPIDFTFAHEGDSSYTPDDIDLGEGVFTSNVCLAYLSPITISVDLSGADASVIISGIENDPQNASTQVQYRILKADGTEEVGWTTKTYADFPITVHLPKEVTDTLQTRSICTNQIYGKITSKTIDTHAAAPPPAPPTANSTIFNHSSTAPVTYTIKVNGADILSGTLGAVDSDNFDAAEALGCTVQLVLGGYSSPLVTLTSNGVTYNGMKIFVSKAYTFFGVDLVGGMVININ
jgi:hypothetical protein